MKILTLIAGVVLLLIAAAVTAMATCYHRVVVVDAIGGTPIPGAYISLQRSSGVSEVFGRTDASGKLDFWSAPLPLPRTICAESTFYPTACVSAISLSRLLIELPVP